jgi:hypothetical protein
MNRVWWRDFLKDVAGRFSAEGWLKLFKVWLGPGSQDLIYVGSERGEVFLQVRRVYFGMEGNVREETAEVGFTEEDCERLGNFISGWEAEREESVRGPIVEGAEVVLSECRVGQSVDKFDSYVLFHQRLLGSVRMPTAFWVLILDNLERAHGHKKGERVCHKIWFGRGQQHFAWQLRDVKGKVFLRIERVCYKEEGEVQRIQTDIGFTWPDLDEMRDFIGRFTEADLADSADLIRDWKRHMDLE